MLLSKLLAKTSKVVENTPPSPYRVKITFDGIQIMIQGKNRSILK